MKIWILTIGEPLPIMHSKDDRLHRSGYFAKYLAERGHEVVFWTSAFDHFKKIFYSVEDIKYQYHTNYLIYLLNGGGYNKNISLARYRDHKRIAHKFLIYSRKFNKPDIIVASFPTIELCQAAIKYGKNNNIPVILDLRDMWPDIFLDLFPKYFRWTGRLILFPFFRQTRMVFSNATALIGITDKFVEWGIKKGKRLSGIWDKSFPLGYPSQYLSENKIIEADKFWDDLDIRRNDEIFRVCFFGSLNSQFDFSIVINAAKRLKIKYANIEFVICGIGEQLSLLKKQCSGLDNIKLPGWIDSAKIQSLMKRSSIGLDPLQDRYDFLATINNKAVEYLSSGLPIISSPNRGVLYELLKENNCGASFDTNQTDEFIALLLKYINQPNILLKQKENARNLFERKFKAEVVYEEMMLHLQNIIVNTK